MEENKEIINDYVETFGEQDRKYLEKWNWGAFAFGWIWGVCHRLYWMLVLILVGCIPYAGSILCFCFSIYMGIDGNKMAWNKMKATMSYDRFVVRQKKWNKVGFWFFWIMLAGGILYGLHAAL